MPMGPISRVTPKATLNLLFYGKFFNFLEFLIKKKPENTPIKIFLATPQLEYNKKISI